ncbi:MAG: mechanosensitive ion channel family protein [Planctomycetes bacterium]|nr:mechanosensitive ion channel family protein [Planctomycetota bacterium]
MRAALLCLLALLLSAAEPDGAVQQAPPAVQPTADSPLAPVKTDSPRDTIRSFMRAMDRHVEALNRRDRKADAWLEDAVRCLDLSQANLVGKDAIGREAARNLKEVIDRVIAVDYDKVPATADQPRWRLRGTEIAIHRVESGERKDEYLFTPDTVARSKDFFVKVKDMPLLPGAIGGGFHAPWQEQYIPPSLTPEVFGIAYWQWLTMGVLIFIGLVMRQLTRFAAFILKQATSRTAASWDDELVEALTGPVTHLGTTGIWFASLHLLGITGPAYTLISFLIKGAFFINLAYLAYNLAGFLGSMLEKRVVAKRQDINHGLLRLLKQTMKILALVFCLLLGAQNMGMDVASLIAGLGIGGLAFALAAKDTLANLFGSIMIMIDRPFRVGDFIVAKGSEGTVEEIGFRCTRIRTPGNSLITIPNSELVMTNIDNLGMREARRVRETYGLVYGTPPERVDAFCAGVRAILAANPLVKPGAFEVWFNNLGSSSLDVLVNYHLVVTSWSAELEQRHAILLQVLQLAQRLEVSFAFPTQTLHIESLPRPATA